MRQHERRRQYTYPSVPDTPRTGWAEWPEDESIPIGDDTYVVFMEGNAGQGEVGICPNLTEAGRTLTPGIGTLPAAQSDDTGVYRVFNRTQTLFNNTVNNPTSLLAGGNQGTMIVKVRPASTGSYRCALQIGTYTTASRSHIGAPHREAADFYFGHGNTVYSCPTSPPIGSTFYLVAQWDASGVRIGWSYVRPRYWSEIPTAQKSTIALTISIAPGDFIVGGFRATVTPYSYDGRIYYAVVSPQLLLADREPGVEDIVGDHTWVMRFQNTITGGNEIIEGGPDTLTATDRTALVYGGLAGATTDGNGRLFDGVNDYVEIPAAAFDKVVPANATNYTFMMKIHSFDTRATRMLLYYGPWGTSLGQYLYTGGSNNLKVITRPSNARYGVAVDANRTMWYVNWADNGKMYYGFSYVYPRSLDDFIWYVEEPTMWYRNSNSANLRIGHADYSIPYAIMKCEYILMSSRCLIGDNTDQRNWKNWDEGLEESLASDKTFVLKFDNPTTGGNDIGLGGGLTLTERTTVNYGNFPGAVDGFRVAPRVAGNSHPIGVGTYCTMSIDANVISKLVGNSGKKWTIIAKIKDPKSTNGYCFMFGDSGVENRPLTFWMANSKQMGLQYANYPVPEVLPETGVAYLVWWSDGVTVRAGWTFTKPTSITDFASNRIVVSPINPATLVGMIGSVRGQYAILNGHQHDSYIYAPSIGLGYLVVSRECLITSYDQTWADWDESSEASLASDQTFVCLMDNTVNGSNEIGTGGPSLTSIQRTLTSVNAVPGATGNPPRRHTATPRHFIFNDGLRSAMLTSSRWTIVAKVARINTNGWILDVTTSRGTLRLNANGMIYFSGGVVTTAAPQNTPFYVFFSYDGDNLRYGWSLNKPIDNRTFIVNGNYKTYAYASCTVSSIDKFGCNYGGDSADLYWFVCSSKNLFTLT